MNVVSGCTIYFVNLERLKSTFFDIYFLTDNNKGILDIEDFKYTYIPTHLKFFYPNFSA